MMQESLALRLRVLRAERRITLREVEAQTGVAKETLSDLERGLRRPKDVTVAKLADFYGVPVEDLLALEDPTPLAEARPSDSPSESAPLGETPFPDVLEMDEDALEDLRSRARDEEEGLLYAALLGAYTAAVEEHDRLREAGEAPEALDEADARRRVLRKLWKVVLFERQAPWIAARGPRRKPGAPDPPDTTGLPLEDAFEEWRGSPVPA